MSTGTELRRLRGKQTQQQMAFEFEGISREAWSSYETGRNRIPPDIASKAVNKYDDPQFAMELASEYTGGAWAPMLNGPAIDLHRTSVQTRTLDEMQEAYDAIKNAVLNIQPGYIGNFEKQDIEKSLDEAADAVTFLNAYIAVICKEYHVSWIKLWTRHKAKLISRGFLKMMGGKKK